MAARPDGGRDKRVCVAQIGAAHGLKGEVRVFSFTEDPVAFAHYGALESEDGKKRFEIETLRQAKDHFVVRLRGIDDRDAAAVLSNVKLYVPRRRLPEPCGSHCRASSLIAPSPLCFGRGCRSCSGQS